MSPLISIILPTYNGAKYIQESIDSVLWQSYKNFELILINDASNDETENLIKPYLKKDSRIKYIKNKENLQLTKSLNLWLNKSSWEYIARIDDDDIWCDREKLHKQIIYMQDNENCWLCGTWIVLINEKGELWEKIINRWNDSSIRNHISQSNQFAHSSVMMRGSIIEDVGYYNEEDYCRYTEDYDLWLRIWRRSEFHNLQDCCVAYRVRSGSITWTKNKKPLINAMKVFWLHKKHYPYKIKWLCAHICTIILPKNITRLLVKLQQIID